MTRKQVHSVQLNRLAEQIGNFIEYWGFKKIHGQIWTHIYLSPEPISALQLIERLQVSKALVSLAMKDLIHYQLLSQTEDSLDKKNKFFTANPNVFDAIRFVLETREAHMMSRVSGEHQLMKDLQKSNPSSMIDEKKLNALGEMIEGGEAALQCLMKLDAIEPDFFLALNPLNK
ncbi:MAG: hypothetical protein H7333_08230 [Bdellovibrionales bacterium]|nr:hypothetical protein [Oligoflexia bacterium]